MNFTQSFIDHERILHSIKTAFAVLIGFIITKFIHLPVDQWLIITIIVVMCAQVNVGSVLQKSYMRFLGTLAGSICAILTLQFANKDPVIIAIVISLSAMIFSYIATSKAIFAEAGTLGATTVVIILIAQNPSLPSALGRFFEITMGLVIAALASQFIFPIHARALLRRLQAKNFQQIALYYQTIFLKEPSAENNKFCMELDEKISASLTNQRKLATDAAREPIGKKFHHKKFITSLNCSREIFRSIIFMHYAKDYSNETKKILSNETFKQFHEKIFSILNEISVHFGEKNFPAIELPALSSLQGIIHSTKNLSREDVLHIDGFLFCAEVLLDRLQVLQKI